MSVVSSWDIDTSYDGQEVSVVFCFVSFNDAESATYSICNSFKQAWDVSQICNLCRRHPKDRLQLDFAVQVGCVTGFVSRLQNAKWKTYIALWITWMRDSRVFSDVWLVKIDNQYVLLVLFLLSLMYLYEPCDMPETVLCNLCL